MLAADANILFISPTSIKTRYLRVPPLLSLLEEGEGCQIDVLNGEDGVVVTENKDIQVLFLGAGNVKLHVQCEHVTYAHSSSKMDPSSFVT